MSKFILDTRLSAAHYIICMEAIRQGIIEPEDLNEGRRTMAEQWAFWRSQPPLAAFPSPFAPHIKKGFPNHAIDANSFNGASQRLEGFYKSLGLSVVHNVPGEAWHMDTLSASELRAAAKKLRKQRAKLTLRRGERDKAIKFLKYQLHVIVDFGTRKSYFQPDAARPKTGWSTEFGDSLVSAVKRFQRDHGLKADGVVGPATDKKIDKAYAKAQKKRKRPSAKTRAQARTRAHERGEL